MIEKIAEAMDYLEAHGIDPIGGMVLLANTDEKGNVVDEKIASVADKELNGEQSAALVEVAQYLGGVNDEIVKVAAEIDAEAESMKEAVASYAITSLEAGMDPMDAFILAGSITPEGSVDEKVASEAVAAGYTDEHLLFADKLAGDLYAETGITPEEAIAVLQELDKEAAKENGEDEEGKIKKLFESAKQKGSAAWDAYKNALADNKQLLTLAKNKEYGQLAKALAASGGTAGLLGGLGYAGYKAYQNR